MQDSGKSERAMPKIGTITSPATRNQLGIFVLDGSGSMLNGQSTKKISLAESVSKAIIETFHRFKISRKANDFSFAVIYYDSKARVELDITKAIEIDISREYDPTVGMGGTTSIGTALKEAKKIAENFLALQEKGELERTVVIVLLSDGLDMTQDDTVSVANTIKSNPKIKITSCFFEPMGDKPDMIKEASDFLRGLCSDPSIGFTKTSDPEKIRTFFEESVSIKIK